ncbi:unnamed protein product [Strongylus vulgaris]|uniref:Pre-rRNA-processing protein TSR2 homolog n=1 Tax=Strongylus vulgaris TaxID=40348 RepID=A0A3P7JNB2_STRVU|nr:unnamed protein product [Strongylus vulgaris]
MCTYTNLLIGCAHFLSHGFTVMTSTSVNPEEWRSIVHRVIASWGGYQLGVDFHSGGPETEAKDEWFKDVLAEFIFTTKGLKTEDLEDWLNNILYTEFNLILEDDSVYPTSLLLHEAFGYLKNNDRTRLEQLLSSLPSVETVREANKQSQREVGDDDEEMELGDISESEGSDDGKICSYSEMDISKLAL